MNWFATLLRVVICFIILADLTEFFIEVLCGWSVRWSRRFRCEKKEERQELKLGDAREGIPSFFNKYRYVFGFVSFMHYVQVLGRLLHLVFIFILCTMLAWDSPWLIYRMIFALRLYLLSMALQNASCASLMSFEVWIARFPSHRKPPFVECSFASFIFVRAWAYLLSKELNSLASLISI